jgi:hypothetical protein
LAAFNDARREATLREHRAGAFVTAATIWLQRAA